jgi:hypothetical protein
MLSSMELQHVVESVFLPLRCRARISPDGAMTVTIVGPEPIGGSSRARLRSEHNGAPARLVSSRRSSITAKRRPQSATAGIRAANGTESGLPAPMSRAGRFSFSAISHDVPMLDALSVLDAEPTEKLFRSIGGARRLFTIFPVRF